MKGVVVKFKVQPGKGPEFESIFKDLQAKVKASEPGALVYELSRAQGEADTYVAVEFYSDQAAFDAHCAAPYFLAAFPKLAELWIPPEATLVEGLD